VLSTTTKLIFLLVSSVDQAVKTIPKKDLPLFKQLASDLESLDKALVKIHESRKATVGKVDE